MRKHIFFLLCAFIASTPLLKAQYLSGRVVDKMSKPVSYATVYILELKQGVITNEEGIFNLSTPEGSYNLTIACLGYKTVRTVWFTHTEVEGEIKTISLEEAEYQIPTLYVTPRKEDIAYTIMRKAIGMAPYYRNLVQSYTAEVYLKGNVNVTKLRGVAYLAMNKEQRNAIKDLSGIQESVSEVLYTAPDKYVQTIKSEKTAANVDLKKLGMGDNDIQMGLANLNIYSNRPNMPLAPNAFQNYTFKYLGDSEIDDQWVAKIQVTPRRKADDLFTGYLFIVREKWCVQALDLSLSQQYIKASAQQTYRFVSDNILLPVAYSIKGEFDGFGLGAIGQFSGSIKYSDVRQNPRIALVSPVDDEPTKEIVNQKNAMLQVQELLEKPELKQSDMRQLRRIQDQAIASAQEEERKERGERPSLEVINNYRIIKDSARLLHDSAYWSLVRPVPLDRNELKLFEVSDSIKTSADTPEGKRKKVMAIVSGVLGSGYTFKIDSLWSLTYLGLTKSILETRYNVVDGWIYGQEIRVRKVTKNSGYIQLRGRVSYAFCRQAWMWNVLAEQGYWANQRAYWRLEVSSQTYDFAGNQGVGMVNDWSSLLFKINPSRFYEGRRIGFNHRIDLMHGLVWNFGLQWEERRPLSNTTNYSWFYKESRTFSPNIPNDNRFVNEDGSLIAQNRSAVIRMSLTYTPQQHYRMYGGRKIMLSSKYPTFSVTWIKGVPDVWESLSDFDFARFQITQSKDFGYHKTVEYRIDAGKFFNTKQLSFVDFHHIYSNQPGVSLNRGLNSFQLLNTYAISTSEWYVEAHVRYLTPYLALKYIPLFKSPLIREGVQVSYLLQPNLRHYIELGYTMNIFMFEVGVFAGFEEVKYRNWGFRLFIPIERFMNAL